MLHSVMTPKRAVNSMRGTSISSAEFACELKVNCGVWRYVHSRDWEHRSALFRRMKK
jgi:hypothetical protein